MITSEKINCYQFPPGTQTWRINKEIALLLGGGRALLMQIAHPMVAQGVADHSDFRERPLDRLFRTLFSIIQIVFAEREVAQQVAARVRTVHRSVTGEMGETVGSFEQKRRYFAENPVLLMWVFATLVDTSIVIYELLFQQLSDAEKDQFYRESCIWGGWLGVSADVLPADYPAFCNYLQSMADTGQLAVGVAGREICESIFRPNIRWIPNIALAPVKFLTIGMLPKSLRPAFGFDWSERQEKRFRRVISIVRWLLRFTPERMRSLPMAWKIRRETR
ncbi:MAG: oxygenase MpaB family protein [Calditrichia bacterium]